VVRAGSSEGANAKPVAHFTDIAQKAAYSHRSFSAAKTRRNTSSRQQNRRRYLRLRNDGWPDIFVVNGTKLEVLPSGKAPTSHLYHNNHDGTFTDVTEKAGLTHSGWARAFASGTMTTMASKTSTSPTTARTCFITTTEDGTFTNVSEKAMSPATEKPGAQAAPLSTTTATASSI